MAGSRKGERRGGAKMGDQRRGKPGPKGPHERRFDPATGTIKPKAGRGRGLMTEEREREMVEIITGKRDLLPKDVQLASMRTIFELAMEYQQIMKLALRRPIDLKNEQQRAQQDADVINAERQMVNYLMLSSQIARDAAPFIHPRLAALASQTDRNTEGDLFDLLLEEINQTPRLKVIEHRPAEAQSEDEEAA